MSTTPVTVLSGPLGAGKTTLLNHLLTNADGRRIAVLVNDMGDVNIDADLLEEGTSLSQAEGGIVDLSNGCICCGLQDDLETEVVRLASRRDFDHLVVEASGISEPEPVARLFTTRSRAAARYDVDATVAVVDTHYVHEAFVKGDPQSERDRAVDDDDPRPLSALVAEQVEFCDLLVLNKCDLLSEDELASVEALLAELNPRAERIRTTYGDVDPDILLGRGLFDANRSLDDGHEHDHDHDHDDHAHPDEVYGVTSFTLRERRPFHPERFRAFLAELPPSVVRAKGPVWVAGNDQRIVVGQAGPSIEATAAGPWIASLPELDQELYRSNRKNLAWDEEWGDRKTEFVVIGRGMDEESLTAALREALLTDEEMDEEWSFDDPFPTEPEETVRIRTP